MRLDSNGSRVLIVGTGTHASDSLLPDVPSVAATIHDLRAALIERCGLTAAQVGSPLLDPTPTEFGDALNTVAAQALDVLVFYYVGHGIISPGNELYLATRETDHHSARLHRALRYATVEDALTRCRARTVVVVLDCCFAGRARGPIGTAASGLELASRGGSYVLAAAATHERALAPPEATHTAFTGELIGLLRDGDPGGHPMLTIEDVYRHLRRRLPEKGAPAPTRHLAGQAGNLVIARNPAVAEPVPSVAAVEPELDNQTCPYRGLEKFTADDAQFFFGREQLTGKLLTRLQMWSHTSGVVTVVGASGAGKSSLLHAGLLPAITHGRLKLPGSQTWPHLMMTPGEHPMQTLTERLRSISDSDEIDTTPENFAHFLEGNLDARLVLVIDQLEELFTLCSAEAERRQFLAAISAAARADGPALVVLSLRADFYGRCLAYPDLAEALDERHISVTPMTVDQLRSAIEKPAAVAGLRLEPGLTDRLLQDLGDPAAGNLPLLSYALLRTWQEQRGGTLTATGYLATGGVWRAVTQRADEIYDGLDSVGQQAMRRILLRMVRLGDSTEDTRRRADLTELVQPGTTKALDELAKARLITVDGDTAQLSHEALLRAWPRLREWIDEGRAGLLIQQRLAEAAQSWQQHGRETSLLYRGNQLELAKTYAREVGSLASEFLAQSIRAERKRNRTMRTVAAILATLLLVTSAATGIAISGQRKAEAQQRTAIARELIERADALRHNAPQLALMLGVAADRLDATPASTGSMVDGLLMPYRGTLSGHIGAVNAIAARRGTPILATAGLDQRVILWNGTERIGEFHTDSVTSALAFSPDGNTLLVESDPAALWDVRDPTWPTRLGDFPDGGLTTSAFSPDGRLLLRGGHRVDEEATVWDVGDPAHPRSMTDLPGHTHDVYAAAFSPDGHTIAIGGGKNIVLWDNTAPGSPRRRAEPAPAPTASSIAAVGFSPDGRHFAAADRTAVLLWDVADPEQPRALRRFSDFSSSFVSIQFSATSDRLIAATARHGFIEWDITDLSRPWTVSWDHGGGTDAVTALNSDGRMLASASIDNTVTVWSTDDYLPPVLRTLAWRRGVEAVRYSPTSGALAVGTRDSMSLVRPIAADQPADIVSLAEGAQITSVAFGSDGRTLVVADANGATTVWDVSTPHDARIIATPKGRTGEYVFSVAVSPNGRLLAVAGLSDATDVWDFTDPSKPQLLNTISTTDQHVSQLTFSPDSRVLATGSRSGRVILWDVTDPIRSQRLSEPAGQQSMVRFLSFTPDGRTLAAGGDDQTVTLWDVHDRGRPRTIGVPLKGHTDQIRAGAFSSDGQLLATASSDKSIIVWDIADLARPRMLIQDASQQSFISSIAFSPDDRTLATGGGDRQLFLRDLTPTLDRLANAHALACAKAGRGLNPDEWRLYIPDLPYQQTCP